MSANRYEYQALDVDEELASSRTTTPAQEKRISLTHILIGSATFVSIILVALVSSSSIKTNSSADTAFYNQNTENVIQVSEKPNFVFIVADDLGYQSIGPHPHDLQNLSPFLTSLGMDGIALTNFYAQEVCTPSRAALLTGRYPITTGTQYNTIQPDQIWGLDESEILLPEVLRDKGNYKNYAIGKWHLGHYSPKFLPTARGFDQFFGFFDGQNYYWSKHMPTATEYFDMTISDTSCYSGYKGEDLHDYSTFLFRDKAIQVIEKHDFNENPMFLYLAFQAVHDPFNDLDIHLDGMPTNYVTSTTIQTVESNISGIDRRQYALALSAMDSAVSDIYDALVAAKQAHNTYIIFTSDNGGCMAAGGRNGLLRGVKGTLFEGSVGAVHFSSLLIV